jgi:hypothetical protein
VEGTSAERRRLGEADSGGAPWRRWGPYLSERAWGTVREDYSAGGDAWSSFSHDQARSRAYRWGEDGIAGISDDRQRLCLAIALWNERDPILKERMFGLTNGEGNHGEDVKEYWFHLDSTPTHSYLRYLYKYPQREFPYADLVATNAARGRSEFEYELLDTGVFADDRYFDVEVEYAKAGPEDLLARVTVHNRGPEAATLHLLPTLWFRNTWSWQDGAARPVLEAVPSSPGLAVVTADHRELGRRYLLCQGDVPLLFTENETAGDGVPFAKDGIGRAVLHGETTAVNPARSGTKVAAHHVLTVPAGGRTTVRLSLLTSPPAQADPSCLPVRAEHDRLVDTRRAEADEFYAEVLSDRLSEGERSVVRQALAGMLWSKQYYGYDVERWLTEHGVQPSTPAPGVRNAEWFHLLAEDVISMPDTWEYPWFAAWDLAFHTLPLAMVDDAFAKHQLELLLTRRYLHPNGQVPAYEWSFSDVNPPVHAWASYFVYEMEKRRTGVGDRAWLENVFGKLVKNFTWWVNRKDVDGRNVFQGGFLGLDNIGVFDRSAPLPTGGHLDQADGTAWMALYCQNMVQIALELADEDPVYAEQAATFLEHFAWIALAVNRPGAATGSMWDEEDGFFYDVLRLPDGTARPLKVRSMVGLLPLAAATVVDPGVDARHPELLRSIRGFVERHPALASLVSSGGPLVGRRGHHLLALIGEPRLRRILARMLDEDEFLSPCGIRSLSRVHAEHPYELDVGGQVFRVAYLPAESDSGMFGGNSNWRGPVWFPVNAVLIRALLNLYAFYGDDLRVECPTGSGHSMTLYEVAEEISRRLISAFLPDEHGRRPVFGGQRVFAEDPHWRDLVLFHEYLHGDNGAGIGASHQTGWTGLVAAFAQLFASTSPQEVLAGGLRAQVVRPRTEPAQARLP